MSDNNTPLAAWPGYEGKAHRLLQLIEHPEDSMVWGITLPPREGDWWELGRIENVGGKMLRWMVERGMLERRFIRRGGGVQSFVHDDYRVPHVPCDEDFGDLWVAA
jgi:hypothetical protein